MPTIAVVLVDTAVLIATALAVYKAKHTFSQRLGNIRRRLVAFGPHKDGAGADPATPPPSPNGPWPHVYR